MVYAHGAFDLFNAGRPASAAEAKKWATSCWWASTARRRARRPRRGVPVLALPERALGVMACRHVDDVIVGAPAEVTETSLYPFDVRAVVAESGASVPEPERRNRARGGADRFGRNIIRRGTRFFSRRNARASFKHDPNEIMKTRVMFREFRRPPRTKRAARTLDEFEVVRRVAGGALAYGARAEKPIRRGTTTKSNRTIELARNVIGE